MSNDIIVEAGFADYQAQLDAGGHYNSINMPYFVFNASTEEIAVREAIRNIPMSAFGLARTSITLDGQINATAWKFSVAYEGVSFESIDNKAAEGLSFDTTGISTHITNSLKTMGKYPSTAPEMNGAINYDGDSVKGTTIIEPKLNFSISITVEKLTMNYIREIASVTSCVNSSKFKSFAPGEVLFDGASGNGNVGSPSALTFNFRVSPNRSQFTIGGLFIGEKKGWDYLWVKYEDTVDQNAKTSSYLTQR